MTNELVPKREVLHGEILGPQECTCTNYYPQQIRRDCPVHGWPDPFLGGSSLNDLLGKTIVVQVRDGKIQRG